MKFFSGKSLLGKLWRDEGGFVLSAELALLGTTGVLATVVGVHAVAGAVNNELNDVANAIGALDQSYSYDGYCHPGHSWVAGSAFIDTQDDCDCQVIRSVTPRPKVGGDNNRHHHGNVHRRGAHHRDNNRKDHRHIDKRIETKRKNNIQNDKKRAEDIRRQEMKKNELKKIEQHIQLMQNEMKKIEKIKIDLRKKEAMLKKKTDQIKKEMKVRNSNIKKEIHQHDKGHAHKGDDHHHGERAEGDHHGHHGHHFDHDYHRRDSLHGRTTIIRAENGTLIHLNAAGFPVRPRCEASCKGCQHCAKGRRPEFKHAPNFAPTPLKSDSKKKQDKKKRDKKKRTKKKSKKVSTI